MTPHDIRYAYQTGGSNRHFFDRSAMKFFGDTMRSYGVRTVDGVVYMYRKPSARVNVFGKWKTAGREFFGLWCFDPETGDLHGIYDEAKKSELFAMVVR